MTNLPAVPSLPPVERWSQSSKKAVGVSSVVEDKAVVIGDETRQEWITFKGYPVGEPEP